MNVALIAAAGAMFLATSVFAENSESNTPPSTGTKSSIVVDGNTPLTSPPSGEVGRKDYRQPTLAPADA
jgi:hypothetical protein